MNTYRTNMIITKNDALISAEDHDHENDEKHEFYCLDESGFGTVSYLTLLTHYDRIC